MSRRPARVPGVDLLLSGIVFGLATTPVTKTKAFDAFNATVLRPGCGEEKTRNELGRSCHCRAPTLRAPGKPFHAYSTSVHGHGSEETWDRCSGGGGHRTSRGTHLPPSAGVFWNSRLRNEIALAKMPLRVMRRERHWIPSGSPQERSKSFHGGFRALASDPSGLARMESRAGGRSRWWLCGWR